MAGKKKVSKIIHSLPEIFLAELETQLGEEIILAPEAVFFEEGVDVPSLLTGRWDAYKAASYVLSRRWVYKHRLWEAAIDQADLWWEWSAIETVLVKKYNEYLEGGTPSYVDLSKVDGLIALIRAAKNANSQALKAALGVFKEAV